MQREGYDLVVYDRSISRLDEYSKRDNVEVVSSPAAVAATEGRLSRNSAISTTPAQCFLTVRWTEGWTSKTSVHAQV